MAKRKIKRYSPGGLGKDDYESSDDYKNLISAAEREDVERIGSDFAKTLPKQPANTTPAEPMKMASFGEAFKEARGRGDKTFEYMGKKYTTEMAKPKAAAPKAEAAEPPKPRSFAQKQEAAGSKMQGAYRDAAGNIKRGIQAFMGMKKGGKVSSASSRADGIAQRGKTRGRIV